MGRFMALLLLNLQVSRASGVWEEPPFGIWIDLDRDGHITIGESTGPDGTFHWWVNDDDDEGDWQAGADIPRHGLPDWSTPRIDGLRDLVDFFPVYLDCAGLYRLFGHQEATYEVRCAGGGLEAFMAGFPPEDAGVIHRHSLLRVFGDRLDGGLESARPLGLSKGGWIQIPEEMLRRHWAERVNGAACLLIEGVREGAHVIELKVTTVHGDVHLARQAVVISRVEAMYRELMLGGGTSRLSEPLGLPDADVATGWTVFIHGYNVPSLAARGWNAEIFKRLHALGSRRKFVGVNWNGATGLDYHAAVHRAFLAGRALGASAGPLIRRGDVVLVAHSLGNVVAGEAVERGGWTPTSYFMVNAAVPAEAYLSGRIDSAQTWHMTDSRWRGYPSRFHASAWHRLFSEGDYRHGFCWAGTFAEMPRRLTLINAYSEGEDVTNCPEEVDSASILSALLNGRDCSYGVWKVQELLKGVPMTRSVGSLFVKRTQGGWGFNERWRGRYVPNGFREPGGYHLTMTPAEAASLTDEQLRGQPFFGRFLWDRLHDPKSRGTTRSLQEFSMFADVLARGVPARTYAAGCHRLDSECIENVNLETEGRAAFVGWPNAGHEDGKKEGRWLHSDFRNAALPYVHPFFQRISR